MSKIVPGGLGGTTLNAKYLNKAGMEPIETSAVIAAQAFIGFVMFIVPLGLFLLLNGTNVFKLIHFRLNPALLLVAAGLVLLAAFATLVVPKLRLFLVTKLTEAVAGVRNNTAPGRDLAWAAAASIGVTVAYILCLYLSLQTIGVAIGISVAVTVYALAVIAKSAIPAPGGLGPVEAAMIAGLIGFGVGEGAAVSAVIIYRLATFWVPIPFSVLSYHYVSRKKLV